MTRFGTALRILARRGMWLIPVAAILLVWALLPHLVSVQSYKLPRLGGVLRAAWTGASDGVLYRATVASLLRLAVSFVVGAGLGVIFGLLMATSRVVMYFAEPIAAFLQAIAGVAWIPLAIVWFGFGNGPVIFVVSNAIFFIVLYNTLLGVRRIPPALTQATRTLGAGRMRLMREVVVPGAMVSVLTGLRSGLAFGWRALIAVEIIAANTGLGYVTLSASSNYRSDLLVAAVLEVGLLWLLMDRLLLVPLERHTIERWGLVSRGHAR